MVIRVLVFASLAQQLKNNSQTLTLPDGATVGDALTALCKTHEPIAAMRSHLAVAVNAEYCDMAQQLHDNDELALISPVSGG